MVFKLVRTDSEDPYKIQLDVGTHLIGRGKFLNCDDKRISRNHGELQVDEDTVIIKALHQNPCFYLKKGIEETQILRQNCTVNLYNGDKFGMLPDSCWYEVLYCTNSDVSKHTPEQEVDECDKYTANTELVDDGIDNNDDSIEPRVRSDEGDMPDSPSLLATVQQSVSNLQTQEQSTRDEITPTDDEVTPTDDEVTNKKNNGTDHHANDENPIKRSHSPTPGGDDDLAKKVKIEGDIKQEVDDIKQETDDVQAGPSNDQMDASGSHNKKTPSPSPAKPLIPQLRERCMYGANCYRKNPQHKAQFSHPADTDWGAGERGQCPWGRTCRRRDPRHWQMHDHPPGTQPPPPPHAQPGMQVVQRHGNIFYINAHAVNFYDDHFQVEDSDGDSVDFDYEF
ncbi:aprataxin and PNK-like factor isoform X2 [Galleria mellonella]|uniref:Aprataxin and PNK-like factor isoform X2 n=1 Tax=Galleria mellonella TaxID=7137 RepID=A0ABM3MF46_GALME|nr:aprataxin and PNK-like factor isoform X2 [Galleria mellonella]